MKERWDQLVAKIDAMSLRERALIFAAVAFALVAMIDSFFLNPLLQQQKRLSSQVVQQQELQQQKKKHHLMLNLQLVETTRSV